jgi:hypothetical protein
MATTLSSTLIPTKYKDDFTDSDGFYRILFNSGRVLQARELTQAQTLLQSQIARFGSNIFQEGGVVKPGSTTLNNSYEFVKLDTTSLALPGTPSSLVGTTFTGSTSTVTAKVLEVVTATGSDPATLFVAYTNAPSAQTGLSTVRFTAGENITNGSTTLAVQTTNTDANPAVGRGVQFCIDQGVYFVKGFFVFTEAQSIIVSKYNDTVNETVGFKIVEDVVTVDDDADLYDNQGAVPNISSPGADRFRITLTLANESELDAADNFVPLVNIKEGVVIADKNKNNSYNIVRDFVATRINENSGDYVVDPFRLRFDKDSDNDNLLMTVSDGIAVVDGYRARILAPFATRIEKPASTSEINNEITPANYGNYVLVNIDSNGAAAGLSGNTAGLPDIDRFQKLVLKDGADFGGDSIGTCRVRAVSKETDDQLRYYLMDIQMNSGKSFRNTVSIGNSAVSVGSAANSYFNLFRPNNKAVLFDVPKNTSLFPLRENRPQALDDISLTTQRRFTFNTDGTGAGSLALTAAGETFADLNQWIFAKADSAVWVHPIGVTGAGTNAAAITGAPANVTGMEVLAYINKAVGQIRSKTLTETTVTIEDVNGVVNLAKADIFQVLRVRLKDSDGIDLSTRYEVDNGQRDNFYGLGKLNRKTGYAAPADPVHVRFKYFEHGAGDADFFAVNSYTGQVNYDQIPDFTTNTGDTVNLRNFLDFRSIQDSAGEYTDAAKGARIHEYPRVNDTIQADVNYYLPQNAVLHIDRDGDIALRMGTPDFYPNYPDAPVSTLPLYKIAFGANTLNDSDLSIEKIEHRRYTMKDIARLERRVDKLEEVTALSLLEIDTKNFEVLDSGGLNRTKSGFFVDNFSTQLLSDTENPEYRAAIDPQLNFMTAGFNEDNVRLLFDSANSSGVVRRGDNLYLDFTETSFRKQTQASRFIKINPFEATVYHGDVDISPASDEWREVKVRTKKVIDGGTKLDTTQAYLWNNWQWNWGGKNIEDLAVGDTTNSKVQDNSRRTITHVNKVVSEETVEELLSQRVIHVALLPFCRSRKIYFKANGLRPSSTLFCYFDGVRVDAFVREETFKRISEDPTDFGNIHNNITQHPESSSAITSDANGHVEGSFFLPNTNAIRFRTGMNEFMILDVSGGDETRSGTIARALYAATGYLDTVDQEWKSTRVLNIQHKKTVENKYYQNSGSGGYGGDGKHENQKGYSRIPGTNTWGPRGNEARTPGGDGCFLAGTMIEMEDGTFKAVETVQLGDRVAVGGMVFACGQFFTSDLHDYKGVKVSGSHTVHEDGKWVRVRDTKHGVPINDETVVVYNFGTEERRLLINGILFTDYFEVGAQELLLEKGDKYFEEWIDTIEEDNEACERILNSESTQMELRH